MSEVRMVVGQRDARFDLVELLAQLEAGDTAEASKFLALFQQVAQGRGACWLSSDEGIQHTLVEDEFAALSGEQIEHIRTEYVDALHTDCISDLGMLRDVLDERAENVAVGDMLDYMAILDGEAAAVVFGFDPWLANRQCEVCSKQPAAVIERHSTKPLALYLCQWCSDVLFDPATFFSARSRREIELDGGMLQWRDM